MELSERPSSFMMLHGGSSARGKLLYDPPTVALGCHCRLHGMPFRPLLVLSSSTEVPTDLHDVAYHQSCDAVVVPYSVDSPAGSTKQLMIDIMRDAPCTVVLLVELSSGAAPS
eukprot:RCo042718